MNNYANYIKPVNIEGTKKILEQMTNCICKVKNNQLIGTGFFCKIPYQNNTKINVLITSYQIINELYLNQYNFINLLMDDYNQLKIINLDPSRNIYFNKEYNTTIIELKECDNINNYLELDDNLFTNNNNIQSLFENESIYILNYLNQGKAVVSYGILNKLNGLNINHGCFIEPSSNGAPILNLSNNKVIGIALETMNINIRGKLLKYPIEDYINKYQIKINQIPIMINNDYGMPMNVNFMPNMMMNDNINFMPNLMMNNMINHELTNLDMSIKNIFFRTNTGETICLHVKCGTTIDQMLQIYFNRIGKPELYEKKSEDIWFLFNAIKFKYGDTTPIEKIIKNSQSTVIVYFPKNVLGKLYI